MEVKLQKLQTQVYTSDAQQIFFGGSCSVGKSFVARIILASSCLAIPGISVALIRKNYGDIIKNHYSGAIGSFQDILKDEIQSGLCNVTTSPPQVKFKNGSTIYSVSVEYQNDLQKIQGSEFQLVFIDESCQLTENQIKFIRSRCRINKEQQINVDKFNETTGLNWVLPKMIFASNPAGPSTYWHKTTFLDPSPYGTKFIDKESGLSTICIWGNLLDNEFVDAKSYIKNLMSMGNEDEVRRFLYGDFTIATEAFPFANLFKREIHIIEPFNVPEGAKVYRSLDWGYQDNTAVLWYYEANGETIDGVETRPDDVYVLFELIVNKTEPKDVGKLIKEIDGFYLNRGIIIDENNSPADTQIFAKTISENSIAKLMEVKFSKADKSPGSRVNGVYKIKQMLRNATNGKPNGLFIFDNCKTLINDIVSIPVSPKNPEDVDTNSKHDHSLDSLRYFLTRKKNTVHNRNIVL